MIMPLHAACHQASYEEAVLSSIRAGGCTSSRASLAGALCAAAGGIESIPAEWISLTARGVEVQRRAEQIAAHTSARAAAA